MVHEHEHEHEHKAGGSMKELCRRYLILDMTFYMDKAKFGRMTVSEAQQLRTLEAENSRLKKLLADRCSWWVSPQKASDAQCETTGRASPNGVGRAERASGVRVGPTGTVILPISQERCGR